MSQEEGLAEVEDKTTVNESLISKSRRGTARRGRVTRRSALLTKTTENTNSNESEESMNENENSVNGGPASDCVEEKTDAGDEMMDCSQEKDTAVKDEVPELDDAPPPSITTPPNTTRQLKLKSTLSNDSEKVEQSPLPEGFTVVEEIESDSDDIQEVPLEKVGEVSAPTDASKPSSHTQILDDMTVIDEVNEELDGKGPKLKQELDTEMVSEDELPAEVSKEQLDTEAVSDEELPTTGDMLDTEAVSEDELPPEGSEKKKRKRKTSMATKEEKTKNGDGSGLKKESAKRKLADGEYDPSSPTSEASGDELPAAKKANVDGKSVTKSSSPKVLPELEKYWKAVKEDAADFTGWTYLLQYVDQENDVEAAREAYDAFLSHYPYCYGYWRKYADYEKRKGNKDKCEEVFERGLKAIPFSVDLWIHYLNYCKAYDIEEQVRNTFEKALEACGLEFRSDRLWEAYIKWETEKKNLLNITEIYDRLLATPTQGYHSHFEQFCEHVNNNAPSNLVSVDEFLTLRQEVLQLLRQSDTVVTETVAAPGDDLEAPPGEEPAGVTAVVVASPEETAKLRERIIAERKKIYLATKAAVTARQGFEEGIKRPYFHVKPLERCQLKNWKDYIEYEIGQGDQVRIKVLFERCLIACALYEEFWLRYLRYLEDKLSDREDIISDVYQRACTIHHKKKPTLHLHWSAYEELRGDFKKADEILCNLEKVVPNLMQICYRRINLVRRSGNLEEAVQLYEHYIEKAKNKVLSTNMSIKYARFCWKILNDVDRAVNVLKKALEKDNKDNPRLYLQLVDMAMQRVPLDVDEVISIFDQYIARESAELDQKVLFAQRKIEILEDFGFCVKRIQKATDEFHKLLKQFQERKKKNDDTKVKVEESGTKKIKTESKDGSGSSHLSSQMSQPTPASGSYSSSSSYGQGGSSYGAPPPQNSYQGNYNQPPPSYNQPPYNQQYNQNDPNYSNYQGWGYSQTGYGNYNQGWGGYNYY